MKSIRFRILLLTCWLIFFYSFEHWLMFYNLSDMFYGIILVVAIVALSTPNNSPILFWTTLAIPVLILCVYKVWLQELNGNGAFAQIAIEICFTVVTSLLICWVRVGINEFESAVEKLTIAPSNKRKAVGNGQEMIYQEVRRARNHRRPLTLLAIGVSEQSIEYVQERMIVDAQMAVMKQYTLARISNALVDELEDCNIVTRENGHFLIAVPEIKTEDVPILIERLRQKVMDQVGVEVMFGAASLSKDSYTLDGLVYKATNDMKAQMGAPVSFEFDPVSVESHMV